MIAATVFFLMESTAVSMKWKTSMNVGALVTLVAAVYFFSAFSLRSFKISNVS